MEDEIIDRIDMPTRRRIIKSPKPVINYFKVPIMELISYKAAMTGRPIQLPTGVQTA